MPAGHDERDGRDQRDGHDEPDQPDQPDQPDPRDDRAPRGLPHQPDPGDVSGARDALMAALSDAGLSEAERADPGFLAEHRAATADLALLRTHLTALADTLTGTPPATDDRPAPARAPDPAPVHPLPPSRRRRPRSRALQAVGVAAAGVMVLWGGLLLARGGGAGDTAVSSGAEKARSDAGSGTAEDSAEAAYGPLSDPGYLACARAVVEGDVTVVRQRAGTGDRRITLRVTRSYKPARAAASLTVTVPRDLDPLLAEGDHVLLALSPGSAVPDVWAVGESRVAAERSALDRSLPAAEHLDCAPGG
ncbi:hypothetical protein [Streptomyces sp. bgisy154]|uniref:hypothetical protein n=1 Tax=Streptomyces sp. bgisy154 TaxID=3413794 RepID=UPI003D70D079